MVFCGQWTPRQSFIETLFDCRTWKESCRVNPSFLLLSLSLLPLTFMHLGGVCQQGSLHKFTIIPRAARLTETITGNRRILPHIELPTPTSSSSSTPTVSTHRHIETVTRVLVLHRANRPVDLRSVLQQGRLHTLGIIPWTGCD